MKANEFVKNHGWEYAKLIVIACESGFLPKNQNYDDLKRLVESCELVESYGGVDKLHEFAVSVWRSNKDDPFIPKAKQAILDVESCHVD